MENIETCYGPEKTLETICYEQIKGMFYYGILGDFKLVVDKATGYFNATKLCDQGGKCFKDWPNLEKSQSIIEYYENRLPQVFAVTYNCFENSYIDSYREKYRTKLMYEIVSDKQINGTYVPKEFILDIASWVSVEFYDRCCNIVTTYFIDEFKKMDIKSLKNKIKEAGKLIKDMETLSLESDEKSQSLNNDRFSHLIKILNKQKTYIKSLNICIEEAQDRVEKLRCLASKNILEINP